MQDEIVYNGPLTAGLMGHLTFAEAFVVFGLVFMVGASIGSFLNVCIARWPAELSVVRPPSRCPQCERTIRWHENIPLLSWLLLGGKCRGCTLPISLQYPLVELLVALGWVATFRGLGLSFEALRVAIFGTILFGIAVTDAKHYLIPDGFTISGLIIVFLFAVANLFVGETSHFATPWPALIGGSDHETGSDGLWRHDVDGGGRCRGRCGACTADDHRRSVCRGDGVSLGRGPHCQGAGQPTG
jgi:leader peptidase (prepilin peptidase) / N-methyltransferase